MGEGYAFPHWQLLAPSFFLLCIPAFSGFVFLGWCYSCEALAAEAFQHWQLLAPSFFLFVIPAFSGFVFLGWCYSCEARAAEARAAESFVNKTIT